MKLSVTVFLGLMLAMLAVAVSGKPNTYLVETADESAEVLNRRIGAAERAEGADYQWTFSPWGRR